MLRFPVSPYPEVGHGRKDVPVGGADGLIGGNRENELLPVGISMTVGGVRG